MNIPQVFLWLMAYSFLGWVYESAACSVMERGFVNRGFLNGPVCPVYGFGALASVLMLDRTDHIAVLFFAGMLLASAVEYATSVLLEKLFHARWWDYSRRRFNINGRVCLLGALVFGGMTVLLVRFIHPFVGGMIGRLPDSAVNTYAAVLFLAVTLDLYVTARHMFRLGGRLAEIQSTLDRFIDRQAKRAEELKDALVEKFEESEFYSERIHRLIHFGRFQTARLARAFPRMEFIGYNGAWQKIKSILLNKSKGR